VKDLGRNQRCSLYKARQPNAKLDDAFGFLVHFETLQDNENASAILADISETPERIPV
jgi:hypothetical protein